MPARLPTFRCFRPGVLAPGVYAAWCSPPLLLSRRTAPEIVLTQMGTPDEERQAIEAGTRQRAERLAEEKDSATRRGFTYRLAEAQAVLAVAETFRLAPPDLIFANSPTLHGSRCTA